MKVFTLQISDAKSGEDFRMESKDPDLYLGDISLDHIAAPACSTTLRDLVGLLCEGPVRKRRRRAGGGMDWGINSHLWELRVVPPGEPMEADASQYLINIGRDDAEEEIKCREACRGPERNEREEEYCPEIGLTYVDPDDTLGSLTSLDLGSAVRLKYDFSMETYVYLRCVKVEEASSSTSPTLGYVQWQQQPQSQSSADLPPIDSVPAFSYSSEKRLDCFYPTFAAKFLTSTSTFGLSSRITREEDSTFCTIEPPSRGDDDIFVPLPFDDIDDLLVVGNHCLERIGRSYSFGMIFPPTEKGRCCANEATEQYEADAFGRMMSGPRVFLSKNREEIDRLKNSIARGGEHFDFAAAFPKTNAMLTSGKFRWLRWVPGQRMRDPGALKVAVGRSKGDRRAPSLQVTRTWKNCFKDLHELFCAVEASWVYPSGCPNAGEELGADVFLPDHDTDLGPSKPLPPDPPVIANGDTAVAILEPTKESPEITAVAIAEVGSKQILFAGDSDGIVRIFDLDDDENEEIGSYELSTHGMENCGVRGLQVYYSPTERTTTVYCWMYPGPRYGESIEDGEDDDDSDVGNMPLTTLLSFEYRAPENDTHFLTLVTETYLRGIEDLTGDFHDPLVSALVIAPACFGDKWLDAIFVGIEGRTSHGEVPTYSVDFSDYDLEDVQENEPSGNILPVVIEGSKCLETWRGHEGCVRALAAVPKKFLISLGVCDGMQWPGQLILWSLEDFGEPLHRIDLYLNNRSICKFPPITGMPGGLCVHEDKVSLWGNYGDTIVPLEIDEDEEKIKMKGCLRLGQHTDGSDTFQGYMASPPNSQNGIIIHTGEERAWIFDLSKISNDPALDKDLSRKDMQDYDGDEWRDVVLGARGVAKAQIKIPEKKAPRTGDRTYIDDTGTQVIAMNGPWVVTGQGNGALIKTKLPKDFNGPCGKTSGLCNSSSWSMPQD